MIASPQTRSREALFGTVKRTTVAREGAEQGARRLLTVEEVTTLARRTQKFERYRACEADLQQELGRAPKDAEVAARLGLPGGAREYRARSSTYRRAKHKLVQSNLRLVYSVAGRFTNRGLAFQDLVQEGSLGMLRAAELFDPERGIKISTYATWWITQSIRRAIANGARDIRIPVHAQDDLRKMRTVQGQLYRDLGRAPSRRELAASMGVAESKLETLEKVRPLATLATLSIDSARRGTEDSSGRDTSLKHALRADPSAVPAAAAEQADLARQLHWLLKNELSEFESDTLRLRFGLHSAAGTPQPICSLDEAGRRLNVGRDKVRSAEARALRKLRATASRDGDHSLRVYLTDAEPAGSYPLSGSGPSAARASIADGPSGTYDGGSSSYGI